MYVCCNAARALLTQRTDLKFCENVLNQPVLCRFFQIFDISPNLAVNEKNGFFRWDTFKGWILTKIDQIFFEYVGIMFLLIGIANEQNLRIMTSSNFWLKIAKKIKIVVES